VASASPSYDYSYVRTHDYGKGVTWRHLNPSSGVYSWAAMDEYADHFRAAGKKIWYVLYGTPTWAALRPGTADPYGYLGGNSPPTNNADAAAFVTALLARYGDVIDRVQVWNEPEYSLVFFWNGSAAEMAALAKAVATPVRAAGKIVVAPAEHKDTGVNLTAFLNASDGAGGFGRQHVDECSFQAYGRYGLRDHRYAIALEIAASYITGVRAAIVAGGLSINTPLHMSEFGYANAPDNADLLASTAYDLARWLEMISVVCLINGIKSVAIYTHDNSLCGNPSTSTEVAAACGRVAELSGKTLTALTLQARGDYRLDTSAGPRYFGHY
jgi:hypothetical protein